MDTTTADLTRVRALMARATGDEKHDESSTSTLDALWVLYDRIMRVDPAAPDDPTRDRFLLSKGHGPVALYAILAAKGFIPESALDAFMDPGGILGSHPDRTQVPGVEASTGSLGHGLAMAVGVALALRAAGRREPRAICLVGDAEMNEGSNWEAVLIAPSLDLGNLTMVVIDNHSSTPDMSPWSARLGAFGWDVVEVDGHDADALETALRRRHERTPVAVVADIPRGEW
ncbi:MAG TPA: transketolase [Candidatus Limnocylindrales bacterium]